MGGFGRQAAGSAAHLLVKIQTLRGKTSNPAGWKLSVKGILKPTKPQGTQSDLGKGAKRFTFFGFFFAAFAAFLRVPCG